MGESARLGIGAELEASVSDVRVPQIVQSKWGQTTWNGYKTFNYDTYGGYPCGCVATAIGQIMRYWQYPSSSTSDSFTCKVNGASTVIWTRGGSYDWSQMPLTASACTTDAQREAIGHLVFDVGVASLMSYESDGSGTTGIKAAAALRTTYGYKSASC